jgi:cell division protein FtsL
MIQKDYTLSIGNIIWVVGIIFSMVMAYSQIGQIDENIKVLEQRLDKKIKLLNECEDRIIDLEKEINTIKNCN